MVKNKVNKSELVRNILQEIGAISENPPENWKDTVIEKLGKNKVNDVLIYQIRRRILEKNGFATPKKKLARTGVSKTAKAIEILKSIGAISDNPPIDWYNQTVDQLKEQKIKLAKNTIYLTRQKAMKNFMPVDFELIMKVKKFADSIGGFKNLRESMRLIDQLIN